MIAPRKHQMTRCGCCGIMIRNCRCVRMKFDLDYDICKSCNNRTSTFRYKCAKRDGEWRIYIYDQDTEIWESIGRETADEAMRQLEWMVDFMDTNLMRQELVRQYPGSPQWESKVRSMPDKQVVAVYFRVMKNVSREGVRK